MYSIGVQPPSATLLKRKPYENAQTQLVVDVERAARHALPEAGDLHLRVVAT